MKISRSRSSSMLSSFEGRGVAGLGFELLRDSRLRRIKPRAPPHRVDGFEPARRNEPRAGIGRHAIPRPLLERGTERIVQRILGQLEVAEQPDQGRKDPPRLRAINGIHTLPHLFGIVICHDDSNLPIGGDGVPVARGVGDDAER